MKRFTVFALAGLLSLITGALSAPFFARSSAASPQIAHAQWSSTAATVAEEVAEADVIVRVRALKVLPTRALARRLPADVQPTGLKMTVDATPFTETRMQVLEVFKGEVGKQITVLQTGGALPETEEHPAMNLQLEGDPLFEAGVEHVLFLKDISGDKVHAPRRKLYTAVNPAGRYNIQGETVATQAEDEAAHPTTLAELGQQIQVALETAPVAPAEPVSDVAPGVAPPGSE